MNTRITVPPEGTCAGKATLVDVSGDPIGYHLREALRLMQARGAVIHGARRCVGEAVARWERERRGE